MSLVSGVLSEDPLFVIINSYTTGLFALVLYAISAESIFTKRFGGRSESRELGLPVTATRAVPALRRRLPLGARRVKENGYAANNQNGGSALHLSAGTSRRALHGIDA